MSGDCSLEISYTGILVHTLSILLFTGERPRRLLLEHTSARQLCRPVAELCLVENVGTAILVHTLDSSVHR